VIRSVESAPRNDDLVVALEDGSDGSGSSGTPELAGRNVRQPEVVTGSRSIDVEVR
jgi:hypothetical protein